MRVIKLYDSNSKLCGFGLQWGKPINVMVRDRDNRILGAMLKYGPKKPREFNLAEYGIEYTYMPMCEQCKAQHAALWCRTHGLYVCLLCLETDNGAHHGCHFYSIAAKTATDEKTFV